MLGMGIENMVEVGLGCFHLGQHAVSHGCGLCLGHPILPRDL